MEKSNEELIKDVIQLYFDNKDWKSFLKQEVKRRNKFKELLEVFSK